MQGAAAALLERRIDPLLHRKDFAFPPGTLIATIASPPGFPRERSNRLPSGNVKLILTHVRCHIICQVTSGVGSENAASHSGVQKVVPY